MFIEQIGITKIPLWRRNYKHKNRCGKDGEDSKKV
jgi:hypothetical protein